MGKWVNRRSGSEKVRGLCVICNLRPQKYNGAGIFKPMCTPCNKAGAERKEYQKEMITNCEECGFKPLHLCQLDVDHIDGNHSNNARENLKTLCANCHRLKTYMNRDWDSTKSFY